MGLKIIIREAVMDDAQGIAKVNYLTWLHAYRGMIPDAELDALNIESVTAKWVKILSLPNPRGGTLVAIKDGAIISYSRFYPTADTDDDSATVASIGSIYVHPDYQHKGVGLEMIDEVLKSATRCGYTEVTLHVLAANERARKYYEFWGWQQDLNAVIENSNEESTPKVRYRKRSW